VGLVLSADENKKFAAPRMSDDGVRKIGF